MSKGKLEFDLNDSDDKESFNRAVNADKAYRALYELSVFLRNERKYGPTIEGPEEEVVIFIEDKFHEIMQDCGIDLSEDYR